MQYECGIVRKEPGVTQTQGSFNHADPSNCICRVRVLFWHHFTIIPFSFLMLAFIAIYLLFGSISTDYATQHMSRDNKALSTFIDSRTKFTLTP